jgi:iron complex outermembrane receptor protein
VARGFAASLTWHGPDDAWGLKASPYYTRVKDYIDAVRITQREAAFNVLRYANADARIAGIDLSGWSAPFDSALGTFKLRGTVSLTDGENRDTGESLYNIVPLQAQLILEHRVGAWRNALELVGAARKDEVSRVRNEIVTPGYGIANLRLSWTAGALRIDAGVENIFDRLYRLPQGGAYVGQGSTMAINGVPWGIAVPGKGRSFYAGLRWGF